MAELTMQNPQYIYNETEGDILYNPTNTPSDEYLQISYRSFRL